MSKKEEIIRQGLAEAKWPGRMEVLSEKPYVLADGAHNPQGVEALFNSLKNMFPDEKFVFLVGVMADKDYRAMMRTMYPLADTFLCATVDTSRSLQADELCQNLLEDGMSAVVSGDPFGWDPKGDRFRRRKRRTYYYFWISLFYRRGQGNV